LPCFNGFWKHFSFFREKKLVFAKVHRKKQQHAKTQGCIQTACSFAGLTAQAKLLIRQDRDVKEYP